MSSGSPRPIAVISAMLGPMAVKKQSKNKQRNQRPILSNTVEKLWSYFDCVDF